MIDDNLHGFLIFLNRAPGTWFLAGESLLHWVTNRELKEPIDIAITCDMDSFEQYRMNRNVGVKYKIKFDSKLDKNVVPNKREMERFSNREYLTDVGLWRQRIDETQPYLINLPFRYGSYLDEWKPLWWVGADKGKDPTIDALTWFTPARKKNAYELIRLMYECADRAGMRDALWLGFGNLLGYVKYGDICKNDNDLDMIIQMDRSSKEKDLKFLEEIKKPFQIGKQKFPHGLAENMYRFSSRTEDNRPLWISIGNRSIMNDNGVKSCVWWQFPHSNHYWHSKGDQWVNNAKIPNFQINKSDKAVCLGMPSEYLNDFVEVDFHGISVNMPVKAGSCCDWWYNHWCPVGKGSSAHKRILAVPDWNKKSVWRMA